MARKIGILLDLVRNRAISLKACRTTYGASERTLLRDLQELRNIGETAGFRITDRENGDVFELSEFKARPGGLLAGEKRLRGLVAELLKAYGKPVEEFTEGLSDGTDTPGFLHVVQPHLKEDTAVALIYRELESAWNSAARVEFGYKGERRTVEPAAAIVRSGRYYLVARDIAKGRDGWRNFSMDLIETPVRRVGSFTRKPAPPKYLSGDAIGFFKGDAPAQTVDVTFSAKLAPAAASRKWQEAQKLRQNDDGTLAISLLVDDVDEVLRWAMGFGDEAWVTAPASAVARARELIDRTRKRYT
jgi:predicted DNA-binding transcriptional regulator YafY